MVLLFLERSPRSVVVVRFCDVPANYACYASTTVAKQHVVTSSSTACAAHALWMSHDRKLVKGQRACADRADGGWRHSVRFHKSYCVILAVTNRRESAGTRYPAHHAAQQRRCADWTCARTLRAETPSRSIVSVDFGRAWHTVGARAPKLRGNHAAALFQGAAGPRRPYELIAARHGNLGFTLLSQFLPAGD